MPKYYQPLLPYFEEEEIRKQHREKMARRYFFGYYIKCKDQNKKMKLIDSYNLLAKGRTRE